MVVKMKSRQKIGYYQELSIGKPSIMDLKICLSTGTVATLNFFLNEIFISNSNVKTSLVICLRRKVKS